jgi:hypothetical protein
MLIGLDGSPYGESKMTPMEIEVVLRPEVKWREAHRVVDQIGRAHLSTLKDNETVTTNQLVNALYPVEAVRGESSARRRLYQILLKVHYGKPSVLDDCRIRGTERRSFGGIKVTPWLWHKPQRKVRMICCPNCQYEWEDTP